MKSLRIARNSLAAPCWTALAALGLSTAAFAEDLSLKLEPGIAIPLTAPQSDLFGVGVSQSLKGLFGVTSFLDVGPAATFTFLPSAKPHAESGTAWGLGAGVRLKRPHDAESFFGISPWIDADALYIRTGELNRPGFDAGVGFSVPLGESRTFWIGPFARYSHVIQIDRVGFDNHDAKIMTFGISFEAGSGIERKVEPEAEPVAAPVVVSAPVVKEAAPCAAVDPDLDHDGVTDRVDHCPDVAGAADNWGCPVYEKLIIKKDKLELKEKLYFAWDQATLEEASFPVLDEVVRALNDNKGFRVQVEGHTDSTGGDDHNQTLSEKRAEAVVNYLTSHGVSKDRLVSKGFASSVPLDTNGTAAGRENNRRVEFVVYFLILNAEGAK